MSSPAPRLPYADETAAETDPRAPMLELIERALEAGIASDLGPQIETRVRRLFDLVPAAELAAAAAALAAADSRRAEMRGDRGGDDLETRLARAAELTGLRSIRARRLTEQERTALDAAIARVREEIECAADSRSSKATSDRGAFDCAADSQPRGKP